MSVEKYHPALVVLHWIIALVLIVALTMGTFVLEPMANDSAEKVDALKGHMIAGILLLSLMLIRLIIKVKTQKPTRSSTGNALLDKLSMATHHGFYFFVILMALSGITLSIVAGLPDIVFAGSAESLPKDFHEFVPRIVHGIIAKILIIMVIAHIAGALYHQYVLKDNLIARMKFGKR
ncbi:MAG: cytochrome b/b6 domain-containing protein [Gammaproteobacteria bacterium]|nr:cytochrome b/b6 domain-containing protein [Gammaproteobacteria bacterium]MDH5731279.1 cytochrome b/b6 domain-containing protein [Gammaproteobacteria bacterium]